jgi:hypothetical protein
MFKPCLRAELIKHLDGQGIDVRRRSASATGFSVRICGGGRRCVRNRILHSPEEEVGGYAFEAAINLVFTITAIKQPASVALGVAMFVIMAVYVTAMYRG